MKPFLNRCRGFSLYEMVVALSLMTTLLFLATHLFHADFRLIQDAEASQRGAARIDHALAALRRDVWASESASVKTSQSLVLQLRDGTVTWTSDADGGVKRVQTGAADEQSWPATPPITFSAEGPVVLLHIGRKGAEANVELTSESQSLRGGVR